VGFVMCVRVRACMCACACARVCVYMCQSRYVHLVMTMYTKRFHLQIVPRRTTARS